MIFIECHQHSDAVYKIRALDAPQGVEYLFSIQYGLDSENRVRADVYLFSKRIARYRGYDAIEFTTVLSWTHPSGLLDRWIEMASKEMEGFAND